MENKTNEITIKDLIGMIVPKLWIVAICAVVFALIGGIYTSFSKKDTYTSDFSMYVYRNDASAQDIQVEEMILVYQEFIYTRDVLGKIVDNLPAEYQSAAITPDYIRSVMGMSLSRSNFVFRISATTTDPALSRAIAESAEAVVPAVLTEIPDSYALLPCESPEEAHLNGKGTLKSAVIGFAFGLILSVVAIIVYSIFDVVIRKKQDLEDNFDIPILGSIPYYETDKLYGGK